jgi:4-carboxymuconolactone decarboxylase
MNHGRLPWLRPAELDEAQKRLYEQIVGGPRSLDAQVSALVDTEGRLHGPFNAFLIDPDIGAAVQNLGSAIRYRSVLRPRAREIATLTVASAVESNFEWHAHTPLGRAAGLTDAEIAAIFEGRESETFDADERQIWNVTRNLVHNRDLDDQLFAEVHNTLGDVILMELIVLVGFYELIARSLEVWRTPLPDDTEPRFSD